MKRRSVALALAGTLQTAAGGLSAAPNQFLPLHNSTLPAQKQPTVNPTVDPDGQTAVIIIYETTAVSSWLKLHDCREEKEPAIMRVIKTFEWRPGSESNRRTRLCRPLHDHSATWPFDEIRASLATPARSEI